MPSRLLGSLLSHNERDGEAAAEHRFAARTDQTDTAAASQAAATR